MEVYVGNRYLWCGKPVTVTTGNYVNLETMRVVSPYVQVQCDDTKLIVEKDELESFDAE